MKRFVSLIVCFIMIFLLYGQEDVYAEQQFLKPAFNNGGMMSLEIGEFSYYYIDQDSEFFSNQPNNTLIRFDYNSGERLILAEDVVDFISNGKIIYFVSGVAHRNQIWSIKCDGTDKELIHTLSSNSIQTILYCENDGFLVFELSDGTQYTLNLSSAKSSSLNNRNIIEEMRYSYIGHLQYLNANRSEEAKSYAIYDINKDNTPELIIKKGTCEADYSFDVFSYIENKPTFIGQLPAGHISLCSIGESGILLYHAHMGYEIIFEGTMYGNKITTTKIYEEDCTQKEYTFDGKIHKFRTGAKYLEVCQDVSDYTLLNNYFDSMTKKQKITVILDKKEISFDQPPIIENGRTLVPLRAIFEAMGATVEWNNATKTAIGHGQQGYDVIVTENSETAYIDGFPYKLDVPVKNLNGRLLAPARFVAEAFGGYVNWIADSQTVEIQSLSTNISDNRYYDENARYSTCYEAAMTHGRLVYIANGYKTVVLRNGYIDKVGNQYKFVNSKKISEQRYYFNVANELVTDYELAEQLDFVYNVNNNEYKGRSEYWSKKANVNNEMAEFKETYSSAVNLLKTGATFLNAGYVMYDAGKLVFDQMVVGTIYPPYAGAALKSLPSELAKTTTRMGFDGIILCGLVGSVDEFNGYCNTIAEIYNKYGYGYITSLEDAERFMSAISGQYLLIKQADAVGLYLKTTYPQKTVLGVMGDLANNIVINFVGTPELDKILDSKKNLKKVYNGVGEVKTYIEGINSEGNVIICKNGSDAFFDANDMIMRNYTLNDTNSKYIELIEKIQY